MIHQGVSRHRLSSNPKEQKFADAWQRMAPTTLGWLLCGPQREDVDYSDRDAQVAATMIQWLGSPVGQSFLYQVQKEIDRADVQN